jgi:hypothetical protein
MSISKEFRCSFRLESRFIANTPVKSLIIPGGNIPLIVKILQVRFLFLVVSFCLVFVGYFGSVFVGILKFVLLGCWDLFLVFHWNGSDKPHLHTSLGPCDPASSHQRFFLEQ